MARIKTKFRGVKHITGRDVSVEKIAEGLKRRVLAELEESDLEGAEELAEAKKNALIAFDKRSYKNINLRDNYTGIRRGIGTRVEQARNARGQFIKRAVIAPSSLPADFGEQFIASLGGGPSAFSPLSAAEAAQQAHERNTSLARRQHEARMVAARAVGRGEVGGIAMANRLSEAQADKIRLESARDEAQRRGESIAESRRKEKAGFQHIPDIPGITTRANKQASNKQASKNTAAGIREAFGGRSLKYLRAMLWTGAGARMVRSFIAMNLQAAQGAATTNYTAAAVGSDFRTLRSIGNVARIFGGNEKDAASLLAMLTKHTSGALVGAGLGPLGTAALRYGLDITGSGPGGLATPKEILGRIADLLKSYEDMPGMVAMIASDIGLSPAMLEAMKNGSEVFEQKLSEQTTISQSQLDVLKANSQKLGELGNAWQRFTESIGASRWWGDFVEGATISINELTSSGREANKRKYGTTLTNTILGYQKSVYDFIGGWFTSSNRDQEAEARQRKLDEKYRELHNTEDWKDRIRIRKEIEDLFFIREPLGVNAPSYLPPTNFTQSHSATRPEVNIDFNFGDLNLTTEQKEEGRKAIIPWLENVIPSTWGL